MFGANLAGRPAASPTRAPRQKKRREELPENIVESQILGFLRARGWIMRRNHVGKHVPLGWLLGMLERGPLTREMLFRAVVDVGERNAADWSGHRTISDGHHQILHVEVKALGQRPKPEQEEWLRDRVALQEPACWADSLEAFMAWYRGVFGER